MTRARRECGGKGEKWDAVARKPAGPAASARPLIKWSTRACHGAMRNTWPLVAEVPKFVT